MHIHWRPSVYQALLWEVWKYMGMIKSFFQKLHSSDEKNQEIIK